MIGKDLIVHSANFGSFSVPLAPSTVHNLVARSLLFKCLTLTVPGIHLLHPTHTHNADSHWLLASQSLAEGGGALWLVRSLHTTEEVLLHFPSLTTRKKKKLCIPQKWYTEFFLWFWNRDFSKPRYTLKLVIVQCLMYMTLFFQMNTISYIKKCPQSRVEYFLWWMLFIYFFFKITTPIHCHYKSWKSQDIFWYNSDCIRLKEESNIHLGCLEGE